MVAHSPHGRAPRGPVRGMVPRLPGRPGDRPRPARLDDPAPGPEDPPAAPRPRLRTTDPAGYPGGPDRPAPIAEPPGSRPQGDRLGDHHADRRASRELDLGARQEGPAMVA